MGASSNLPVSNEEIPYRDWYPIIKRKMRDLWSAEWQEVSGNKMRKIKNTVKEWKSSSQNDRKQSIILTRLRIGHTKLKLSHKYLMERDNQPFCGDCILLLTILHILTEFP